MDVKLMSSVSTQLKGNQVQDAVQISLMKKTMDQGSQSVQNIIKAMPKTSPFPSHLGNNIDVRI